MAKADENGYFNADAREIAPLLGDLHGEIMQQVLPLTALTPDEREQRALDGLAQLREHDLLTDAEVESLTAVLRSLHPDIGPPQEQAPRVRTICDELQAVNAGPVALAIAAIAMNSVTASAKMMSESVKFDIGDVSTVGQADCAGGIVGATGGLVIGLGGGGPAAVLIGALGGAAAGSAAFYAAQALLS